MKMQNFFALEFRQVEKKSYQLAIKSQQKYLLDKIKEALY